MLNYVTLILDVYDGTGNLVMFGSAKLTPSTELTDTTDVMFISPATITANFGVTPGVIPQVKILATDNANLSPTGWTWAISFTGMPGNPAGFSFFLPYTGGATQYLSSLVAVEPVIPSSPFLPMPSGTPTAGYVPVVIANGSPATQWEPASQSGGAVASVFGRTGTVVAQSGDYTAAQVGADVSGAAAAAQAASLAKTANLSDLASAATARTNLGLGTAATQASSAFDAAGAASTAQTNAETYAAAQASAAQAAAEAASVPLAGGTMGGYLAPDAQTLTFGTSIAVNAALGNAFNLTLTASTGTIANPSNAVNGQIIRFRITQGTGGSFTVAWGSAYDFGAGTAPTLSTAAGKVDIIAFEYVGSISKWCCLNTGGLGY